MEKQTFAVPVLLLLTAVTVFAVHPCSTAQYYKSPVEAPYRWTDILSGSQLSQLGAVCSLGFNFSFCGSTLNTVVVYQRGYLSLGSPCATQDPPSKCEERPVSSNIRIVAPVLSQVDLLQGGSVSWESFEECPESSSSVSSLIGQPCFIAQWTNVSHWSGQSIGSFQVVLFESGSIEMHLGDISIQYLDHFTGIASENEYCQWSCRPTGDYNLSEGDLASPFTTVRFLTIEEDQVCGPTDDGLFCITNGEHDNEYLECMEGTLVGWRPCAAGTICKTPGKHSSNPCVRNGTTTWSESNSPSEDSQSSLQRSGSFRTVGFSILALTSWICLLNSI